MRKLITMLPNREGIRLKTFVFIPDDASRTYPVVVTRNPYASKDKTDAEQLEYYTNYSNSLVDADFAVVVQNCRGRGGSEGDFVPFHHEREDGLDLLAWIEEQNFCEGNIYLSGGSYLSYVNLSFLDALPPSVKGAHLGVMSPNGQLAFFKGGAFKADIGPVWYMGMYHTWDLKHKDSMTCYKEEWLKLPMSEYSKRCYGYDAVEFNETYLLRNDPNANPDGFSNATNAVKNLKIPVLWYDGWSEMFFQGMSAMWDEIPLETRKKSVFVLGPWSHDPHVQSDAVYPFTNGNKVEFGHLEWFKHLRYGTPLTNIVEGKLNYYHAGKDCWETSDTFPQGTHIQKLFLNTNLSLSEKQPAPAIIQYEVDPENAPWFPGGPNTFCTSPQGFAKQPEPNFHPGVRSFISSPLNSELTIAGNMSAKLVVSSDCEGTMFLARLCVVELNGNTTIIQDAPLVLDHITPNIPVHVELDLGPLIWTFHKGEQIRLDISSADAHSYRIHTNLPGDIFYHTSSKTAHNSIDIGESFLELHTM